MTVKPQRLETAAPFDQLFPIDEQLLLQIVDSMRRDGFHKTKPIKCWKDAFASAGRLVVVDGHTRLAAAKRLRIKEVPVDARHYDSATAAYLDAVREQVTRRNMPRDQIAVFTLRSLQALKEAGERSPSKARLAKTLGVGTTTIARARAVLEKGGEEMIRRVLEQEVSLFDAYEELGTRDGRPEADAAGASAFTGGKDAKPRRPTKAETRRRNALASAEEGFAFRRDEHPDPGAYEALLEAIVEAEEGRPSVDFELDTSSAFELAFERLHRPGHHAAGKRKRSVEDPAQPKRKAPTWGGKRKHKLYEEIRLDGDTRLRRLQIDIADAVRKLEHMELPEDVSLSEEAQDDIATLYEDLMILLEWTEGAVKATVAGMGDLTIRSKIEKLRERAQDPSSTPHERTTATRAADRLQEKHRTARLSKAST